MTYPKGFKFIVPTESELKAIGFVEHSTRRFQGLVNKQFFSPYGVGFTFDQLTKAGEALEVEGEWLPGTGFYSALGDPNQWHIEACLKATGKDLEPL